MTANPTRTLLVIDDDKFFCSTVETYLNGGAYTVISAHSVKDGKSVCNDRRVDVILLDQKLPDGNGIDLCPSILQANDQAKIIFITAFPNFDHAVTALRLGAFDYLSKPIELEELSLTLSHAFRTLELETVEQIQHYREKQEEDKNVLIGREGGLANVYGLIELAAENSVPVLITGETGTGKNVVAKTIHYRNSLRSGSFISINCAALPENLIESELFGCEKGAFTGAFETKKGVFELADGGTLFLDEIGELPLHLQSKLLGVLDELRFKRLGGQSFRATSARIIAATNINLEEAVDKKNFRQDLFYRLSVLPIHLPPLRKRTEDIPELCDYFIRSSPLHHQTHLPNEEIPRLKSYSWPGNVRELKNIIERSMLLQQNGKICPSRLLTADSLHKPPGAAAGGDKQLQTLAEVEKEHIEAVLRRLNHNHTHTSRALGISRSTLHRKLRQYAITRTVPY